MENNEEYKKDEIPQGEEYKPESKPGDEGLGGSPENNKPEEGANEEKKQKGSVYDQYRYWGSDNPNGGPGPIKGGKKNKFALLSLIVLIITFGAIMFSDAMAVKPVETSYSAFIESVENSEVKTTTIVGGSLIEYETVDDGYYSTRIPYSDPTLQQGIDLCLD